MLNLNNTQEYFFITSTKYVNVTFPKAHILGNNFISLQTNTVLITYWALGRKNWRIIQATTIY